MENGNLETRVNTSNRKKLKDFCFPWIQLTYSLYYLKVNLRVLIINESTHYVQWLTL